MNAEDGTDLEPEIEGGDSEGGTDLIDDVAAGDVDVDGERCMPALEGPDGR